MKVRFWGVRGSIPAPPTSKEVRHKIAQVLALAADKDITTAESRAAFLNTLTESELGVLGGNTPCVELSVGKSVVIFDMGTGLRPLGEELLRKNGPDTPLNVHIFIGHTHWDHIQGFPFFIPAYRSNTNISFYHLHPNLHERLAVQQDFRFFPVSLEFMASKKEYYHLTPEQVVTIDGAEIRNIELNHPGKAFGYRADLHGKSFVYASDSEYNNLPPERIKKYIEFYRGTDLLVFDAPFSFDQELEKINWGHSSALVGIDISVKAGVKRLALFHHAPENDDTEVFKLLETALDYKNRNYPDVPLEVFLAREGMEIEL